jgi:hypothetical protein
MVAAVVVVIGGITGAAYAAVLPGPVQHVAYHLLDGIGVPDAHHSSSAPGTSGAAGGGASVPSTSPSGGCPCQAGQPTAPRPGQAGQSGRSSQPTAPVSIANLVLAAARAQVPADGNDTFSGQVTSAGQAESGVQVQLLEQVAGQPGWRLAGSATTDSGGDVSLTVQQLTSNASFRLTAAGGAASTAVPVTVIPGVYLHLVRHPLLGIAIATARAGFAQPGDVLLLQELSGTGWVPVGEQVLNSAHRAYFTVPIPRLAGHYYRVALMGTAAHGASMSGQVWLARR